MSDVNTRLVINPVTRTIAPKYRNQKAVYVAKGDHNSVLINFEMPRYVDGYDMSAEENIIHIHYANIKDNFCNVSRGFSDAVNVEIEKDNIIFSWLVPNTATRYAGVVSIGVTFERYENVNGKTEEVYSWSTAPYGKTTVWDSLDNTAEVTEREYDYLVKTCNAIVSLALEGKISEVETTIDNKLSEAEAEINQTVEYVRIHSETVEEKALEAESWCSGDTGTRVGEDTDNALYYCNKALECARNSEASANASEASANASAESAESARLSARDVDVIKNDTWQYRVEAEQYAQQAKENAETINPIYSNALKGKVTGTDVVRLDDVSSLRHDINITTDIETSIKSYGKNLCDLAKVTARNTDESVTQKDNVSFEWDGTFYFEVEISLPAGTTFTYSWGELICDYVMDPPLRLNSVSMVYSDGTISNITSNTYTLKAEKNIQKIRIYKSVSDKFKVTVKNLQIEVGNAQTEFEVFKPYINGVVAISPTTTLIADTSGVQITAEYNRDINNVIAKLEQAIANL